MSDDEESTITIDELAELAGLAYRTVRKRLRLAGVRPRYHDRRGMRYPRAEAFAAIEAAEEEDAAVHTSARERLDLVRARREELELARLEGRVMLVEDAEQSWTRMIVAARTRLLAIPAQPDTPADFRPVLEQRIRDALQELAEWEPPAREADPSHNR